MNEFIIQHQEQFIQSAFTLIALLLIGFVLKKGVRKVAKMGRLNKARTLLILKYVNVFIIILTLVAGSLIWSVNFADLGLVFSSVFAVIGVALFAQWSILSNITAGIILFFSFPFKIGDRIDIQDKDSPSEGIIEDIRAFHVYLRNDSGELIIYPNNLLLQKGIVMRYSKK